MLNSECLRRGPGGTEITGDEAKRETVFILTLHCHHQNDSCIKVGSEESRFNVTLIVRDSQGQSDVQSWSVRRAIQTGSQGSQLGSQIGSKGQSGVVRWAVRGNEMSSQGQADGQSDGRSGAVRWAVRGNEMSSQGQSDGQSGAMR